MSSFLSKAFQSFKMTAFWNKTAIPRETRDRARWIRIHCPFPKGSSAGRSLPASFDWNWVWPERIRNQRSRRRCPFTFLPLQAKSASLETARASSAVGVYCPGEGCSAVVTSVPQAGSPQLGHARQVAEANPGPAWPAPSLVRQPGASATYGSRNRNTQHRVPRNRDALFSQNQEEIRERDVMQSYQERHSAPCCYMDEPLKAWCAVK